ncbi:hypothetical protein [Streptomyces sp. NPDC058145]|uniref:hypothetical protein n=1 Tax=Streptomyces sp. NPDC058145 TaxID=3346356 RepID=UPI0036ED3E93
MLDVTQVPTQLPAASSQQHSRWLETTQPGQRSRITTEAEPAFLNSPQRKALEALGESFLASQAFTPSPEIGAVAALEFGPNGKVTAVAEPNRRGGGSAMVVHETP